MTKNSKDGMLVSLSKLSRMLGLGRVALYRLLHREQLPKAVVLNGRRYWLSKDIENWLELLKEKR